MAEFLYPSYVLSDDRETYLTELTNKSYKTFVKTIALDDVNLIEQHVDTLLQELSQRDVNVKALTSLDKLYMLLCVRSYCIAPTIIFSTKIDKRNNEGKREQIKTDVPLNLNEVLNRLGNYPIEHKYKFDEQQITVQGTLPKKFYYKTILEVAADSLSMVKLPSGSAMYLHRYTLHEKTEILNKLPSSLLSKIIDFLRDQETILKEDSLIKFNTDIELPFGNSMDLHLYNGTVGEIIKLLFNTDLKELYTSEYTLMRRFKFTFAAIQTCTPAELSVYYEIIHKDLEREKQEMQEQQRSSEGPNIAPPQNLGT